jgi:hypothetical protein
MGDGGDFRVIEDRAIEFRRRFGLIVKPQAGRDFWKALHGGCPRQVEHTGLSD